MSESTPSAPAPHARHEPRRVVSGMRPTGKLHLGHFHGAVKNWIAISQKADCFFFSADWHALTTEYADPSKIEAATRDMFADWVAAGLDPERVTLFIQSRVKQHAELYLLLSMITPLGWLERVPTFKEQQEQLREKDLATHGFLGYPVLQTADVAVYGADSVPVGQDQVSHLELARELVRRFNHLYAKDGKPVLVEPRPLLTAVPKILGLDGRKMSKSYGNAIELGEAVARVDAECRTAGIGCVDCKKLLLVSLLPELEKHRAARAELDRNPGRLDDLVQLGTRKAQAAAEQTMEAVRAAMKLG